MRVPRCAVAPYRDVETAVADGDRSFPPEPAPGMRSVHYVHHRRSRGEVHQVDPTRPGALLYEQVRPGQFRLVGAMLTAPVEASLEELNERVPLSVTQWHLHQNICVPQPIWDKRQRAGTATWAIEPVAPRSAPARSLDKHPRRGHIAAVQTVAPEQTMHSWPL